MDQVITEELWGLGPCLGGKGAPAAKQLKSAAGEKKVLVPCKGDDFAPQAENFKVLVPCKGRFCAARENF